MGWFSSSADEKNRQRQLKQSLSVSEQRVRFLQEQLDGFFWETDVGHCYTYLSARLKPILGYEAKDLLGQYRQARFADDEQFDSAQLSDQMRYVILKTKSGSGLVCISCEEKMLNEQGECIGYRGYDQVVSRDVEHVEEGEAQDEQQQLKQHQAALARAEEAVCKLVNQGKIILQAFCSRLLRLDKEEIEILDQYIHIDIESWVNTARSTLNVFENIERYLMVRSGDLSPRYHSLTLDEFEQFFDGLFKDAQVEAVKKHLGFAIHYAPNLPAVIHCDEDLLGVALYQIVDNAIKYSNKGCINIAIDFRPMPTQSEGQIVIQVKDNGIGIPQDKQQEIFSPFNLQPTENAYGGVAVGLYISRAYVKALGGEIILDSTEGLGSEFTLKIPMPSVSDD